jgi:ATPase subunit of ABC transporter with duplicated ATPase domains
MAAFAASLPGVLSPHIDEDTVDYICSLLSDPDCDFEDEGIHESIDALIDGSVDDEDQAQEVKRKLWEIVGGDAKQAGDKADGGGNGVAAVTRLLTTAVTMSEQDITTTGHSIETLGGMSSSLISQQPGAIAAFFANQIGVRTEAAISEKLRRKNAQKKLREEQEKKERELEIANAMKQAAVGGNDDDDPTAARSAPTDVRLLNFSLPNKKGSGEDLLSSQNLTLAVGRRLGLVGRNGCGKTTLMELLARREIPGVPAKMSLLLVKQEIIGSEMTPLSTVMNSDTRRIGLQKYIENAEKSTTKATDADAKNLANAYERLSALDEAQGAPEPRALRVLTGLGFSSEMVNKPTKELSGGWRMRVSIACALFAEPDLLLLDEPTNHLDLEAVMWLEKYLTTKFKGTLLLVSHDRHFLNAVVTDVVHFHKRVLTTYRGDINNFEAVRDEMLKNQARLREIQEDKRKHMQAYIDKHAESGENGVKAAKQRKSKMKKLERIGMEAAGSGKKFKISYDGPVEDVEEVDDEEEVQLIFPDPGAFDGVICTLDRASFGYDAAKPPLIKEVDMTIDLTTRTALLGRNGAGKSTLIKLIVGALEASKGSCKINGRAKIEYLAQHQLEQLDPYSTPLETMMERYPGDGGMEHNLKLRRYLAKFGLGGEILPHQKVHTMSGGQKCRLCLAGAMYREPHLLILDEPTNHLDIETTQALITAINGFGGGVLLVSHDQHLLTSCCKDIYVVGGGRVERLPGTSQQEAFNQYKKDVVAGRK